ncbi:MAG TPA: carboxypeptidase-like regulatory domain-containing protein [Bryobacteraceae bacterium]|nr:carboxypeptidase-like regulatory domain-containing protein [Bryobacteraceae bacterium]
MAGARYFFLVFAALYAFGQPAGTGVIGGVVIDKASGDPVRKAIVTVTWHGEPRSWATVRTGSDGRFRVEGLPAGNYEVRAQKPGIGSAIYGVDRLSETGELIALENGQTRDDLILRFLHAASISGRVVDSDGDPIPASVMLYRQGRNLGEKILVRAGSAQANERGEFKLANIQAGHYYLSATAMDPNGRRINRDSAFYGDTADWKQSNAVTVHDGESLTGIDFHIPKQVAVELHGRIRGLPPPETEPAAPPNRIKPTLGTPRARVTVYEMEGAMPFNIGAPVDAEGQFRITLSAGRYRFDVNAGAEGEKTYAGSQIVDVQPGMGDLELAVAPVGDLKGRLKIEGGTPQQPSGIQINLQRSPGATSGVYSARPAEDGSFTIEQVSPGEWSLNVAQMPRGAYLKSATLGEKDVRFERFAIEAGSDAALNIVISMNTASIYGQVSGRAGILLAPVGKYHDLARFYFSVATGDDGKFKMMGIPPGRYKVFALEKIAAASFRTPEGADALDALGGAEEVDLSEGASVEVHPKLIPYERLKEVLP